MLYLQCTAAVQKAIGLRKENLAEAGATDAPLGNWYVNRFVADRRSMFIFMSEPTLLSFVLFQGVKPVTAHSLPTMLLAGLRQLLEMRGLPESAIDRALVHYETGIYAKTDSKSALGSLNDLVQCYGHSIESQGGLASCDLTAIIMGINRMPQRKLAWRDAWEATDAKLGLSL